MPEHCCGHVCCLCHRRLRPTPHAARALRFVNGSGERVSTIDVIVVICKKCDDAMIVRSPYSSPNKSLYDELLKIMTGSIGDQIRAVMSAEALTDKKEG